MQVSVPSTGQDIVRGGEGGYIVAEGTSTTTASTEGQITTPAPTVATVVPQQPVPITITSIDPNIQHHQVYSIQPIQVQPQQTITLTQPSVKRPIAQSPPKKMGKKGNKKNVWVPGKPLTPKAREMMESGKGSMNQDGRWTCVECNRSLSNEWTLEQHIQTVHGERIFNCKNCNKKFKRRDHLLNHIKTIHKGLKPCKKCNVVFINKEELRAHKMAVHLKLAPEDTAPPPLAKNTAQDVHQYLDDPSPPSTPVRHPATTTFQAATPIQTQVQRSTNVVATYDNLVDGFTIPQHGAQQVVVTVHPQHVQGQQITYQQQPISVVPVPVAVSQVPQGTAQTINQVHPTAYITQSAAAVPTTLQSVQPVAVAAAELTPTLSASPVKPITYRYIVN